MIGYCAGFTRRTIRTGHWIIRRGIMILLMACWGPLIRFRWAICWAHKILESCSSNYLSRRQWSATGRRWAKMTTTCSTEFSAAATTTEFMLAHRALNNRIIIIISSSSSSSSFQWRGQCFQGCTGTTRWTTTTTRAVGPAHRPARGCSWITTVQRGRKGTATRARWPLCSASFLVQRRRRCTSRRCSVAWETGSSKDPFNCRGWIGLLDSFSGEYFYHYISLFKPNLQGLKIWRYI